jgi:hypothetical protein
VSYSRLSALGVGLILVVAARSGANSTTTSSATAPTTTATSPSTTTTSSSTTTTTAQLREIDSALVGDTGGDWKLFPDSGNGGYDVAVYDYTLVLADDLTALDGFASITAVATQDLQRFSLDARGLNVASVSIDGLSAEFAIAGPELIVTLDEPLTSGEEFAVTVDYAAAPELYRPSGVPFSMGWDVSANRQVLVHGFPGSTATWAPVNASKGDTAPFVFGIDPPDGFTATASGAGTDDGDFSVWDTQREVTDFTFAVAEYETSTIDWNGVPIAFSMAPDSSKRKSWEEDVPEMLEYLETIFGPFPYESLGLSSITSRPFALAAPMRILIPEDFPKSVLVHELAHQWAGNAVATADPETYAWMYEGLATYTESLYAENQSPDYSFGSFGLPPTTRPLDEVDSIDDLLDAVTYNRGALLYHALRLEIGDEAFFATLWEFIQSNLHGTAEIDDLQAVAEEMADADLGQFLTSWVSEAVVPDLPPAAG